MNRTTGLCLASLLCISTVAVLPSLADGFRNPPPGAVGMGRAGVIIAQVPDASAVFYNPANLALIQNCSIEAAVSIAHSEADFSGPGGSVSSDTDWQMLPNFFMATARECHGKKYTLGIGVTSPFGQGMDWPEESFVKYNAPFSAQMSMVNVNPSVGMHISESVLLGAGVDVYWSRLKFKQAIPWARLIRTPAPLPDGVASFEGNGTAVGGNIGLTWLIDKSQRLGLTYRSQFDMSYEGDFEASNMPQGMQASDFSSELKFPNIIAIGYGVEVTSKLSVEADFEWLNWARNDSQPLDIGSNNALLPPQMRTVNNSWKDTVTAGVSAEYRFDQDWALRAGYAFLQSPVPDRTFSPVLGDTDAHEFTLGIGWHHGSHALNAAYALSIYKDRSITGNQTPAINGEYSFSSDLISLSYVYTLP